jgi:ligand-binding sensor domain-containing protein
MKSNRFLPYFICFLVSMPVDNFSQSFPPGQFHFEHYTLADGLSSEQIKDIAQDKFGFIWIATPDGLDRFDGRQFTIYRHKINDSTSLANDIINAILADESGKLWVATNNGLCYYDFSDDRFHQADINKNNKEQFDRNRVYGVLAGKDKTIWYITKTELHSLQRNGSVQTFFLPDDLHVDLLNLFEDEKMGIWIGTNKNRVLLFDRTTKVFTPVALQFNKSTEGRNSAVSVSRVYQAGEDTLLAGTWYGGLQKIIVSGKNSRVFACPDKKEKNECKWIVPAISRSFFPGQHWIATYGNGIGLFDESDNQFTRHLHHNIRDTKSLCNDYVNAVFMDASGILWVGTDKGLDKYDTLTGRFSNLQLPETMHKGLIKPGVIDMIGKSGDSSHNVLWLAVPGQGLLLYHLKKGVLACYDHDPTNKNSLMSNFINCLYRDKKGVLWIGTKDGVCTFDENTKTCKPLAIPGPLAGLLSVSVIMEDSQNRMWVSTFNNGVYCYDPDKNQWIVYRHSMKQNQSLPDDHVFCMLEDSRERIWIGTQNQGLCVLDSKSGNWKAYRHEEKNNQSLPDNNVYSLYEDKNRRLWIATENGLAVMNEKNEINSFTTSDGLCNNNIFGLLQGPDKHIWIATNNGLSNFDPSSEVFTNYYTNDGLITNSLGGAFKCLHDGNIYIGVPGGISFFNPKSLKTNKKAPQIIITSFKVFDREYPVSRVGSLVQPVNLSYRQNMITIGFAALNFTNAGNNSYAYKLDGFDKNWIYCGNRTSATYTNLDGGKYTFRVKAANNEGVWNEIGASLLIGVTSPFWKTGWFYFLSLIFVASALYLVYYIRLRQLAQLQNIRSNIARDLHDDVGSTLSSISMMSRMAAVSKPGLMNGQGKLLDTIAKASQQAMDLISDIVWSVNPANDKMENMLIRMREYAAEILDASNIRFTLVTEELNRQLILPIEKRKDFLLIFKEAVNNLAKYSGATEAWIRMIVDRNEFKLTIEDNGTGFDVNKAVTGNGLKNMSERAKSLQARFSVLSRPNMGTLVSLSVPFIR